MDDKPTVRTCLWFAGGGQVAAKFYVSLLPDSRLETRESEDGEPLVVEFTLAGTPYMILNGGPQFKQTPAASIFVSTKDQDETDRIWNALVSHGGKEGQCAWLTDRFGVSWQIVPEVLPRLLSDGDQAAADRVRQAMMTMRKIDIAALEAAYRGS